MITRAILLAAGLASLAALGGCVVADDRYAYDGYDRPYATSYYGRPYYERHSAYRDPAYDHRRGDARWDSQNNTWAPSRWDSRWDDRYRRNRDGFDRP